MRKADSSLQQRWERARSRGSLVTRIARAAFERPWTTMTLVAVAVGALYGLQGATEGDPALFAEAGRRLLSGDLSVYGDATVQTGPLELILYGVAAKFASLLDVGRELVMGILTSLALVSGTMLVRRSVAPEASRSDWMGVGLTCALGGFVWVAFYSGHVAEGLIPLLWIGAAQSTTARRPARAGLLIGLAAGFKLWGLLGVPLVLMTRRPTLWLRSLLILGALVSAMYLPLLLNDSAAMFSYDWITSRDSLVGRVLGTGLEFDWGLRLLQGCVVTAVTAVVALRSAGSTSAAWAGVLAATATRLLVDPLQYYYYWLPVGMALLMAVSIESRPGFVRWIASGAGFYASLTLMFVLDGLALTLWVTVACVGAIALAIGRGSRTSAGSLGLGHPAE